MPVKANKCQENSPGGKCCQLPWSPSCYAAAISAAGQAHSPPSQKVPECLTRSSHHLPKAERCPESRNRIWHLQLRTPASTGGDGTEAGAGHAAAQVLPEQGAVAVPPRVPSLGTVTRLVKGWREGLSCSSVRFMAIHCQEERASGASLQAEGFEPLDSNFFVVADLFLQGRFLHLHCFPG